MNCKEFEEIADSYLSGELLVETNHEPFRHMEACSDCLKLLAERREIRQRLRNAVKAKIVVDPAFVARVRSEIRQKAIANTSWSLVPALSLASFLIVGLLGVAFFFYKGSPSAFDSARTDLEEILHQTGLMAALHDALGNHRDCGLKYGSNPAKVMVNDNEYEALKTKFSGDLEFVEKHDCIFKDRKYSHTILRNGQKLISILKTESDSHSESKTILSVPTENLQIAEFQADRKSIFVISDLTETENLQIARVISDLRSI